MVRTILQKAALIMNTLKGNNVAILQVCLPMRSIKPFRTDLHLSLPLLPFYVAWFK